MPAFYKLSFVFCMAVFFAVIFVCVSVARDLNLNEKNQGNSPAHTYWNEP